ncbi:MAG: hypothetical protein RLZZ344_1435 [Pseudomonadota bacterium]|jgi:tRNA 2-selenouridine synthase
MAFVTPNPRIVSARELLGALAHFDTIIDTRTPPEFEEDHIPGAINLPVLTTDQRVEIGTLYKEDAFRAKRRGAAFVAQNIAEALLTRLSDKPRDWQPVVYCWRGGNRSGSMATIFSKIGWRVCLLEGGYRAYRREVIEAIRTEVSRLQFHVICGVTGSGKTRLLAALGAKGHQVLDLEGLAQHKGSLLGFHPEAPQPSQKYFESLLLQALRCLQSNRPVYVESESRKIGQVQVPEALILAMRGSPCSTIDLPLQSRVDLLCDEYSHFFAAPETLKVQIQKLVAMHGNDVCSAWSEQIDASDWRGFVEALLEKHYDPSYRRSLPKNYPGALAGRRITLTGATLKDYESAAESFSG